MSVDILVPPLGESVTEATVAKWYKQKGEGVSEDELIVELETDKVTLEVNAPSAGTIEDIIVGEGASVEVGALLGKIVAGQAAASAPKPANQETPAAAPASGQKADDGVVASPAAKKIAAEKGIDLASVAASGKDGRVTKGDVVAPKAAAQSAVDQGPREERVKMTRLRQSIAKRLKASQDTAAILSTFNEVDMTNIMALRKEYKDKFEKKHGCKLGFMSFFVKAAVSALQEIPEVNAQIDGDEIIYKNYCDIGVAVGTPSGLVVPILRDAQTLSFAGVEQEIVNLGKLARDGKLTMEHMTGGTFTISNGGVYGSLMSTPIINPPQSAILGMHKIQERPMVVNGEIKVRPMMYLALSYDHRLIDGKEAVTFLVKIKDAIENPERLLLDI